MHLKIKECESMEDYTPVEKSKEAGWNSAQETARRLAYWIQKGNDYYHEGNHLAYKNCLMVVFKEVATKMKVEELENFRELIKGIRKDEIEYNNKIKENDFAGEVVFDSELPNLLDNFDIELRRCADNHNMLIPNVRSMYDSGDTNF
jgi:hypothetical protein